MERKKEKKINEKKQRKDKFRQTMSYLSTSPRVECLECCRR